MCIRLDKSLTFFTRRSSGGGGGDDPLVPPLATPVDPTGYSAGNIIPVMNLNCRAGANNMNVFYFMSTPLRS